MIVSHPRLTAPPDDAVLWRYIDFTKLVSLLEEKSLYFAQALRMADPYEGVYPKGVIDDLETALTDRGFSKDRVEEAKKGRRLETDLTRASSYLLCWHMNPHQSAAMWKMYLKSDEGVAIRTTFGKIKTAFQNTPEEVDATVVKYIDYATERFDPTNTFTFVAHKRRSYEFEQEVRLIWRARNEIKYVKDPQSGAMTFEGPAGKLIPVSLPDLVEEILVSPNSQDWFYKLVTKVVETYKLDRPVRPNDFNSAPLY